MAARSIANTERTSSTTIDRGLYLLRYIGTTARGDAPLVHIRASYGSEHLVLFVAAPGAPPLSLDRPGSALVIRADSTVNLQITVQASATGALDAELKLEPIDGPQMPDRPITRSSEPIDRSLQSLELSAHVSRRGDVSAGSGQWIAGPGAPSRIEGIAARWPSASSQHLEYQVMVEGASSWSEWSTNGRLAGTRGEARALVGVRFRLAGAGPHTLRASALFLGSAPFEQSGSSIELRSPSGFDPLVGLSLEAVAAAAAPQPIPAPKAPEPQFTRQPESRGRVRVFRAGGEQT